MTFRVVRTNQYNQDLGLFHSTNGNHLESSKEGSSIDHQVTIYLHAQNITMFPTNETCWNPELALEWKRVAIGVRSFLEKSVSLFSCWFKLQGEHFSLN
ncbi:calmodulin-binding protein [Dorcoceras hygrometricum]|uniref:Calmodulin-binding protein n=1 Tax=Dorcoceras hygrometricum TaxID=472368 RepID=A0A2Z7CJT0_9LAMI|nr:calmodulin-binding protein [Dorcoceras hygrometricum]